MSFVQHTTGFRHHHLSSLEPAIEMTPRMTQNLKIHTTNSFKGENNASLSQTCYVNGILKVTKSWSEFKVFLQKKSNIWRNLVRLLIRTIVKKECPIHLNISFRLPKSYLNYQWILVSKNNTIDYNNTFYNTLNHEHYTLHSVILCTALNA